LAQPTRLLLHSFPTRRSSDLRSCPRRRPPPAPPRPAAGTPGATRAGPAGASALPAVRRQAVVDAALLLPQRVALALLGVEEAAPDLLAPVHHACADLGLRQRVAGVADPGAGAAQVRVAGPVRPAPAGPGAGAGRGRRARRGRAAPAPGRALGGALAARAATSGGRVRASGAAPITQGPQRHPARIAVAGVA